MKEILFHICCGPCATASVRKLQKEGYRVTGFYYNPNINPEDEYEKRLLEAKKLANNLEFELIVPKYLPDQYHQAVKGDEGNMATRCPKCWELRIERTAVEAKKRNIPCFGTTLRISPYQNQEKLLEIGKRIAKKYGLEFYENELVPCFHDSVTLSKEQGMYRQKYCGCIYSKSYK